MRSFRQLLGVFAAVLLVLSSGLHSILGWRELSGNLIKAKIPADLFLGLKVAWFFSGLLMLALGIVFAEFFLKRRRGVDRGGFLPAVIGGAYLAFGIWSFVISGFDPFFFTFIVPGVLLAIAAPAGDAPVVRE